MFFVLKQYAMENSEQTKTSLEYVIPKVVIIEIASRRSILTGSGENWEYIDD